MFVSRCRTAACCLTALAFTAMSLTACTGKGSGRPGAASATASHSASVRASTSTSTSARVSPSATGAGASPAGTSGPVGTATSDSAARWAGTKQFVQIRDAWISGGRTYLSVRTARKTADPDIEALSVAPGQGPYTTVLMAMGARVLLSVPLGDDSRPLPYSQATFVSRLTAKSPRYRAGLGYDLSFDGTGQVTRLQSMYTP